MFYDSKPKPLAALPPVPPLPQARTKEGDDIGREGPVSVGQPGIVRAPSGLITGTPTTDPATKGRAPTLITPDPSALLLPDHVASRVAGRLLGWTGRHLHIDYGDRSGACVRRSQEGPRPQICHSGLCTAQAARERQLWEGGSDPDRKHDKKEVESLVE